MFSKSPLISASVRFFIAVCIAVSGAYGGIHASAPHSSELQSITAAVPAAPSLHLVKLPTIPVATTSVQRETPLNSAITLPIASATIRRSLSFQSDLDAIKSGRHNRVTTAIPPPLT